MTATLVTGTFTMLIPTGTIVVPPGATSIALDTYSGIQPQLHSQCCATNHGQYTNLTMEQYNATAPPGLILYPNISSDVIGHCHLNVDIGAGPSFGMGMNYQVCLQPGAKVPADLLRWYAITTTLRDGEVIEGPIPGDPGTQMVTLITGRGTIASTVTSSYSLPWPEASKPVFADFYSGLYLNHMVECCDRSNGTTKVLSIQQFNASAPIGLSLPTNLSSTNVGNCRVPLERGDEVAKCLNQVDTTPTWYVATQTFTTGDVMVWIQPGLTGASQSVATVIRTIPDSSATGTTASAAPGSRSAASSRHAKFGLVSLVGLAATSVVLF